MVAAHASAVPRGAERGRRRPTTPIERGGATERGRTALAPDLGRSYAQACGVLAGTHDAQVGTMDILTWLIVGLIAGVLASLLVGSGGGILIDIVVGIVGAFIGGWLFSAAGWHTPFAGLAGTIFVAFIGSVILLVVLHLIHGRPAL